MEVAELRAECAARHYLDGGSPAPVKIQHPYRSPPHGRFDYVSGFNTLTARGPVVVMLMTPLTVGPR